MNTFSLRTTAWLGATVVTVGLLGAAGCSSSSPSSSSSSSASASPSAGPPNTLTVKQIVLGTTLKHSFQPNGKGAAQNGSLSQPDDIATLGGNLYVGFQNGVGSQGEPSTSGNLDSTLVEFTPSGSVVRQWDVTGKIDGLGADSATGQVIATVDEDGNSSLYAVSKGKVTHYSYSPSALPHQGGTDAVSVYKGQILIMASAPGSNAPASAPAVFVATLNAGTKTASLAPFFADNAPATGANGSNAGKGVTLALTDPDSSAVVPSSSSAFAGDFVLNSQGDEELIFSAAGGKNLQVLKISNSVDDIAWATAATGSLFTTDSSANTVDALTGTFTPGTVFTSVTPCNANSAPSTCPAPGFPANSLGTIDLTTGAIGQVTIIGPVTPKGLVFVP